MIKQQARSICRKVAKAYGVPYADVIGPSTKRRASEARRMAMYLISENLRMPYVAIGEVFTRDHSTVSVAITKFKTEVKIYSYISPILSNLKNIISNDAPQSGTES
jgi:chromosomal replication initiation ATPase DnaA